MSDRKKLQNEFVKKGLVLCLTGVVALGMMACGSGSKKKVSTQAGIKVESNEVKKKEQGSTSKTDATQSKIKTGTQKQDNKDKTNAAQSESKAGTQKKDNKEDVVQSESKTGTQKKDNKEDAAQSESKAGTQNQDKKADAVQSENNAATQKQDKKADAAQTQTNAGTQKQEDNNTNKDIKDTQNNKTKEGSSSKK